MNSNQSTAADFTELALDYASAVAGNFSLHVDAQPEDQLKAPVGDLIRGIGQAAGLDVNWRTEVRADDIDGRPDIGVTVGRLLIGHVELKRSGRKSSPLDDIRPERWEFTEELLELLWTLERTIALQPAGAALLEQVMRSGLFTEDDLPRPTEAERLPPDTGAPAKDQLQLNG